MSASLAIADLKSFGSKSRVSDLARFYKTAPGEYGEGDLFLGGSVPQTRSVASSYKNMELVEVQKLFNSPFHEARLCAAIILNLQFKVAKTSQERKKIRTASSVPIWVIAVKRAPGSCALFMNSPTIRM